ncbi:CaiB/BaiF CoA transferase family protein [Chloroflexota bacterium]
MMSKALEGLKVLDFSWAIAGPLISKHLADFGATVVKVESSRRIDNVRISAPAFEGVTGANRSGYFAFFNGNKLSLEVDLNSAEGTEIARKLVVWADVIVESFRPGNLEKWGLGSDELLKLNPSAIIMRCTMQGQTGPYSKQPGMGIQLAALSGFTHLTGWPDRQPVPPFGAYTDAVAPPFGISALIAALLYRRRTGKGQCLDLSQYEASLHFLSPVLIDYNANGVNQERMGNADPEMAPHGVFPCREEDTWCAISVTNEIQWQAFCNVLGKPEWLSDSRFVNAVARKHNEAELNELILGLTLAFTCQELMSGLQANNVPAGMVQTTRDLTADPQLKARHAFWKMEHREMGSFLHMGSPLLLSKTPACGERPAPCIGEHTQYVLQDILGLSEEEIGELLAKGVCNIG